MNIKNENLIFAVAIVVLVALVSFNQGRITGEPFHNPQQSFIFIHGLQQDFLYVHDIVGIISKVRLYGDLTPLSSFRIIRNPGTLYQAVFDIPLNDLKIENVADSFPPYNVYARDIEVKVTSPHYHAVNIWDEPVFYGQNTIRVEVSAGSGSYVREISYELAPTPPSGGS